MYELSVESEFCAAHALMIAGERETVHGHNFKVTVTLAGSTLDADGLLVDFHAIERLVADILGPYNNRDLNASPPFAPPITGGRAGINPTAENLARHIFDHLNEGVRQFFGTSDPRPISDRPEVAAVRVTEAPGCSVVYRRDPSRAGVREPI